MIKALIVTQMMLYLCQNTALRQISIYFRDKNIEQTTINHQERINCLVSSHDRGATRGGTGGQMWLLLLAFE